MSKVIVITGHCGAGKTTICKLFSKKINAFHLQGDNVKEELFPSLVDITKHPNKLVRVEKEILSRAKESHSKNIDIIVDYIVLGNYITEYKNAFGEDLVFKVLLPSVDVVVRRDNNRDCWIAGKEHINDQCFKFNRDEELVGRENYIDSSTITPEETVENILNSMDMDTKSLE
jgi:cytidylate kinase